MYEDYYGFSEKPFSLTPDPKYLFKSESHANAFELLQYANRRREGFVVVTGDIGTGKTTLCRDSILAAPIVLDLALFLDLAKRAGMSGIQEWLSFYFKSPQVAPGLYPEHDLFIQQIKLKNTLRWLMGEEQITHLGQEYYQE